MRRFIGRRSVVACVLLLGCDSDGAHPSLREAGTSGAQPATGGASASESGGATGGQGGSGSGGVNTGDGETAPTSGRDAGSRDAGVPPDPPAGPEGPSAAAFDTRTGMLNVDYAGFLSKHDVVYRQPNDNPLYGLTVGNGRTGAMVWNADGLTMQVSGVDTSEQTAFSAGLVTLQTLPALDPGTSFEQRLSLYDGSLITTYGDDRRVTIMGAPSSEIIGIHVEDAHAGAMGSTFDIGLWDVSKLGNSGNVPDLGTWKNVSTYADASGAGISRGQTDSKHFGYTFAATVQGAAFTTAATSATKVRLSIEPASSYTIWLVCATRLDADGFDSLARAKAALADVSGNDYATTRTSYEKFWHGFWARSFVQYAGSGGASDYLENVYYLSTYMIASGAFGHYPFHFINGVFRATGDDTKWSNAYWYWNQRDVYDSFFASNHADVMHVFNDMYAAAAPALRTFTESRFGVAGIWVPETMGFDGNADGTVGSDFTKNIFSTGVEAANNMYLEYRYTGNDAYLRDTAYPFMRDVANFYAGKLSKNADGQYHMASSNAHETYWNVPDAITDLAAVRSMFPLVIAASQSLGMDGDARAKWQDVLDHLVQYPEDAKSYLPHAPPIAQTHNGENVACELIWPYGVTGIGAPDYARALSTWKSRPFPYGNVWANDAIQAARLGLGDETNHGLVTMLERYQNYPNGLTNNTNGVFEYLGVHLSAMNEALLQSYDDVIRVFPAMPSDGSYVGRFTLLAKGGFLVSSEKEGTEIKYVGIKSTLGGTARIMNPWTSEPVEVRDLTNGTLVMTSSSSEIDLATMVGAIYVMERVSKPFASYDHAQITGIRNTTAKTLDKTQSSLGIVAKQ